MFITLSTAVGLLFPFHMQKTSKRAMCGYPMAEVGLGPRAEGCVGWAGGVHSTQQQGAVDCTVPPVKSVSTPRRK